MASEKSEKQFQCVLGDWGSKGQQGKHIYLKGDLSTRFENKGNLGTQGKEYIRKGTQVRTGRETEHHLFRVFNF